VYLSTLEGHVPVEMLRTFSAYLARCSVFTESTLNLLYDALGRFYEHCVLFQATGVREPGPEGFALPRQHSIKHYPHLITEFGALNGLCSSITESKHIRAVKEPWRRSSRNQPLRQILVVNQRLDKLVAASVDFANRGMIPKHISTLPPDPDPPNELGEDNDGGPDGGVVLNHIVLAKKKGM
jgi:hypothetical protein